MSPCTISTLLSLLGTCFIHHSMDLQVEEYKQGLQESFLKPSLNYSKNIHGKHKQHLHMMSSLWQRSLTREALS